MAPEPGSGQVEVLALAAMPEVRPGDDLETLVRIPSITGSEEAAKTKSPPPLPSSVVEPVSR